MNTFGSKKGQTEDPILAKRAPGGEPSGRDTIWSGTYPRVRLWDRSGGDVTNC